MYGLRERPLRYASVLSSAAMIPVFARASIAMLQKVNLPSISISSITLPPTSSAWYNAPSTPISPIKCKIKSFAETHLLSLPLNSTLIVSGTLNQVSPDAMPQARSVEPTPVANAPNAPYVQVCESAPIIKSPAVTMPASGKSACSIPILPTSKKFSSSCSFANSLIILTCSADLMSLLGTKWSGTKTHLDLSKTFLQPIFLNSLIATGPVMSLASVISNFAVMSCPGLTSSKPA